MEFINHYTVNTSHNRKSYPHEVDKNIYFMLAGIVKKAIAGEMVEIFDYIYLTLGVEQDVYVATLWDTSKNPLLVSIGATSKEARKQVLKIIRENFKDFYRTTPVLPDIPFIADIITPFSTLYPGIFTWTGDFTRCLGWFMIAPEKIR